MPLSKGSRFVSIRRENRNDEKSPRLSLSPGDGSSQKGMIYSFHLILKQGRQQGDMTLMSSREEDQRK